MSGEERAAEMAKRRAKKDAKVRAANNGKIPTPAQAAAAADAAEEAAFPLHSRLPPHTDARPLSPSLLAHPLPVSLLLLHILFALVSSCDSAPSCTLLGSFEAYATWALFLLSLALLVARKAPRLECFLVSWLLLPVWALGALPVQLRLSAWILGSAGYVPLSGLEDQIPLPLPLPTLGYAPWEALVLVSLLTLASRRCYACHLYSDEAGKTPIQRGFRRLFVLGTPVAAVSLWYVLLRDDRGWWGTDMHAWPGIGSLMLYSLSSVFVLWFLLRVPINSFYGPIYWSNYGRYGVAFFRNTPDNTIRPLILSPDLYVNRFAPVPDDQDHDAR